MRITLKVIAIFERTRLTLVDIDRHQARHAFTAQDAPFAPGRKTCAAKTAQTRRFHGLQNRFDITLACQAFDGKVVAASATVVFKTGIASHRTLRFAGLHRCRHIFRRRMCNWILSHHCNRRLLATTNARRWYHAHINAQRIFELTEQ